MGANKDQPPASGDSVSIKLVNGFTTAVGGVPVVLPVDAQRLVAFVALEGRALSRAYVAGRLWSEVSQDRAFGNLRSALWRVRKEVDALDANAAVVSLHPGVTIDVRQIEHLAQFLSHSDVWPSDVDLDHKPLCGELLPGWYDEWTLVERERLRQICLHALEMMSLRLLEAGRFTDALEASLAAVALEPLRESGHRAAIRVHLAEGNFWEAKRHYEHFAAQLRAEMGLGPSPILDGMIGEAMEPAARLGAWQ